MSHLVYRYTQPSHNEAVKKVVPDIVSLGPFLQRDKNAKLYNLFLRFRAKRGQLLGHAMARRAFQDQIGGDMFNAKVANAEGAFRIYADQKRCASQLSAWLDHTDLVWSK